MKNKKILVLGADGMVGQTVFRYLHQQFPECVWGTTRNKQIISKGKLLLRAENVKKDLPKIVKQKKHIDYVINCIALLEESQPIEKLIEINSLFPHILEELAEKHDFNLIHISTDAVFSPLAGNVTEQSLVSPTTFYGKSKLLGETVSGRAITIRSSFLGIDPLHHHGFLEKILQTKKKFPGFANQSWTGCTTVQFAKFCKDVIENNKFKHLRKLSPIYHFTPLGPVQKYQIAKECKAVFDLHNLTVKKVIDKKVTRKLSTDYFDFLNVNLYNYSVTEALKELKKIQNTQTFPNQ